MSRSRTTCGRCFSSTTRCHSTTTRSNCNGSNDRDGACECQTPFTYAATGDHLTLKEQPSVPLEAEVISPDVMAALRHDAIRVTSRLFFGKRQCRLDDFFDVDGEAADQLAIRGDVVQGQVDRPRYDPGPHHRRRQRRHAPGRLYERRHHRSFRQRLGLGRRRDARRVIHIRGNAGGQVGAAYRGSLSGMNEGTILIEGSAGLEVGMRMRRGIIVVKGLVRDFAGLQMKGGTIILLSGAEIRTGAWMVRGTIVSLSPIELLPTFAFGCRYQPTFLRLYAKHLQTLGVSIPQEGGEFERYVGDTSVPGKGEILIWKAPDPLTGFHTTAGSFIGSTLIST